MPSGVVLNFTVKGNYQLLYTLKLSVKNVGKNISTHMNQTLIKTEEILDKLSSSFDDVFKERDIENTTKFITGLADALNDLVKPAKAAGSPLRGIESALSGINLSSAAALQNIKNLSIELEKMGENSNIQIAIDMSNSLGVMEKLDTLVNTLNKTLETSSELVESMGEHTSTMASGYSKASKNLIKFYNVNKMNKKLFEKYKTEFIDSLKSHEKLNSLLEKTKSANKKILALYERMKPTLDIVGKSLHNMYSTLRVMTRVIKTIISVLKGMLNVLRIIGTVIRGIVNILKTLVLGYFKIINATISAIFKAITWSLSQIWGLITKIVSLVWNGLVVGFKLVIGVANLVKNVFVGVFNVIKNVVSLIVHLPETISNVWMKISRTAKSFEELLTLPSRVVGGWADSLEEMGKELQNAFFRVYTTIWMLKRMFGQALDEAVKFEQYIKSIEALRSGSFENTSGNITKQFLEDTKKISDFVKQIAVDTGSELNDVATAYYFTVSNGITDLKNAALVVDKAAWMAKISVSKTTDVLQAATAAINAYELNTSQIDDVLKAQFELVRKGVLVYKDITSSMGKVYTSAKNLNIDYKTLYGMVGYLSKIGLNADKATTALNTLFTKMSMQKTVVNFGKAGINLYDTNGQYRDFLNILGDVNKNIEGLSDNARIAYLSLLKIPLRAQKAFLTLVLNYKTMLKYMGDYKKGIDNLTTDKLQKMFTEGGKAFTLAVQKMQVAWQIFTYNITGILKANTGVTLLKNLTNIIANLTDYVRNNSDIINKWVKIFVKLGAIITGVWLGLKALSIMLNPFTALIGGLGFALLKTGEKFSAIFDRFINVLKGKDSLTNTLKLLFDYVKTDLFPSALEIFADFYKRLGILTEMGLATIGAHLLKMFKPNSSVAAEIANETDETAKLVVKATVTGVDIDKDISPVINKYFAYATNRIATTKTGFNISDMLFGSDLGTFSSKPLEDKIFSIINTLLDDFKNVFDKLGNTIPTDPGINGKLKTLGDKIADTFNNHLMPALTSAYSKISGWFSQGITALDNTKLVQSIKDFITTAFNSALDKISKDKGIIPALFDTFNNLLGNIDTNKIKLQIKNMFTTIEKIFIEVRNNPDLLKTLQANVTTPYAQKIKSRLIFDMNQDFAKFQDNLGLKNVFDNFIPSMLYGMGIGTFEKPKGAWVTQLLSNISSGFMSVMTTSLEQFTTTLENWSVGKDSKIDVAGAALHMYGSVFDLITKGLFGINLETGEVLEKATTSAVKFAQETKDLFLNTLNTNNIDGVSYLAILKDDKSTATEKLVVMIRAILKTVASELANDDTVAGSIADVVTGLLTTFVNNIMDFIDKHKSLFIFVAALMSGNAYAMLVALGILLTTTMTEYASKDKSQSSGEQAGSLIDSFANKVRQSIIKHSPEFLVLAALQTGNVWAIVGALGYYDVMQGIKVVKGIKGIIDLKFNTKNFTGKTTIEDTKENLVKLWGNLNSPNNPNTNGLTDLVTDLNKLHSMVSKNPNNIKQLSVLKTNIELFQELAKEKNVDSKTLKSALSLLATSYMDYLKYLSISIGGNKLIGGYTANERRDKPVGVVHGGEWIAPAWMVNSPKYKPIIGMLEGARTGVVKGFADGGIVDNITSVYSSILQTSSKSLIDNVNKTYKILGFTATLVNNAGLVIGKLIDQLIGQFIADQVKKTKEDLANSVTNLNKATSKQIDRASGIFEKLIASDSPLVLALNGNTELLKVVAKKWVSIFSNTKYKLPTKQDDPNYILFNAELIGTQYQKIAKLFQTAELSNELKKVISNYLKNITNNKDLENVSPYPDRELYRMVVQPLSSDAKHTLDTTETLLQNLGTGPILLKYAMEKTNKELSSSTKDTIMNIFKEQYKANSLNNASDYINTPEFAVNLLKTGGNFEKAITTTADNISGQKVSEANKAFVKFFKGQYDSIEAYADLKGSTVGDAIRQLSALEEKQGTLMITVMGNIQSTLGQSLTGLISSMQNAGILSSDQLEGATKVVNGVMQGGMLVAYGMKTATDYATGNWTGMITDGIATLTNTFNLIGNLFGNWFKNDTKALIDNTSAIRDLSNIQRQIQQQTYNGNTNVTIRLTNNTGETIGQVNTSSGYGVYDFSV